MLHVIWSLVLVYIYKVCYKKSKKLFGEKLCSTLTLQQWNQISCQKYITGNIKPVIFCLVQVEQHKAICTPAHYYNFYSIEYSWAYVKERVDWQYSNKTTLQLVYKWLIAEFQKLVHSHVAVWV